MDSAELPVDLWMQLAKSAKLRRIREACLALAVDVLTVGHANRAGSRVLQLASALRGKRESHVYVALDLSARLRRSLSLERVPSRRGARSRQLSRPTHDRRFSVNQTSAGNGRRACCDVMTLRRGAVLPGVRAADV